MTKLKKFKEVFSKNKTMPNKTMPKKTLPNKNQEMKMYKRKNNIFL